MMGEVEGGVEGVARSVSLSQVVVWIVRLWWKPLTTPYPASSPILHPPHHLSPPPHRLSHPPHRLSPPTHRLSLRSLHQILRTPPPPPSPPTLSLIHLLRPGPSPHDLFHFLSLIHLLLPAPFPHDLLHFLYLPHPHILNHLFHFPHLSPPHHLASPGGLNRSLGRRECQPVLFGSGSEVDSTSRSNLIIPSANDRVHQRVNMKE
ncbi:hypothetical protein Pcinc_005359 [Petrolisthes cinctipes]|uniref:Uncharacterized protein n=1 Tax=Petrolisthes cinctipes TaxID=88211 RepID=A0AAE1KZE7_PETCI|nr:hypothetical protein Pcinc_005359 [Petrolisthes cinctipes]